VNPAPKLIAIVEDDPAVRDVIAAALGRAGFRSAEFACGARFREYIDAQRPDLTILDLNLPDGDGMDICRDLKRRPALADMPIIILSARTEEMDRVLGIEMGADDYVTKPFSTRELVARVKAQFRHEERQQEKAAQTIEVAGMLLLDLRQYKVFVQGKPVELTPTEFRLLRILAERPGWVFSRDQILDGLWGDDKVVTDRTVDFHITNLKRKLGKAGALLKSLRGLGYKLEP